MLIQIDGSHHDWLQGRGPRLVFLAAIDDATGVIVAAKFQEQETSHGYLALVHRMATRWGVPQAHYHDRHSIFRTTIQAQPTAEQQLAGERPATQFEQAMRRLGIVSIVAHSPQAKGRVERLFETLRPASTSSA